MKDVGQPAPLEFVRGSLQEIRAAMDQLQRRDYWLWGWALLVIVLLAVTVASFAVPALFGHPDADYEANLKMAVRGLLGLVLLFGAYVIYQQVLIGRLRRQMARQIDSMIQLQMRAEELQELATLDALTGLYNRRVAEQNLTLEISRSGRQEYPLTVLALDLDSLKRTNDVYGHAAGDLMLKAFAARLRKAIRSSDLPARMGGDEFLVVLPECDPDLVPRILARLTNLEIEFGGKMIPVVFSAGWAGHRPGERVDQLLRRADQALYSNKRTGKVEEQVRQAQAQIQQAQHMETVGRLVGGVAHDFNNLLMTIKGYSDLVHARLAKEDPLRSHVEEIQKASERANALTQQVLAFGRRQVLEPRLLDLNAVLGNMELVLKRLVGEDIELKVAGAPRLGKVRADQGQMEQILLNLVANAREAMPHGGTLGIQTADVELDDKYGRQHPGARPGPHVMLAVSDSGIGLEAETRNHLFEPGHGAGLGSMGLAAVYGVVKQSGGYITVDSEPGQGSTFRVYLPRVEEAAEVETVAAAPGDGAETVLVVEDESSVLKLAREFLESSGYRVLEARDGAEALEVSDKHEGPIHLVMTDVVMPKMNGWELAKHLAIRRPEAKVLYVSGYADDAVVREGLLDPEVPFLRKPFTLETLARKVRELLENERKPQGSA